MQKLWGPGQRRVPLQRLKRRSVRKQNALQAAMAAWQAVTAATDALPAKAVREEIVPSAVTVPPAREETVPSVVTAPPAREETALQAVTAQPVRPPAPSVREAVRAQPPALTVTTATAARPEAQGPVRQADSVLRDRARAATGRERPSDRDVPARLLPTGPAQAAVPQAAEALHLLTAAS